MLPLGLGPLYRVEASSGTIAVRGAWSDKRTMPPPRNKWRGIMSQEDSFRFFFCVLLPPAGASSREKRRRRGLRGIRWTVRRRRAMQKKQSQDYSLRLMPREVLPSSASTLTLGLVPGWSCIRQSIHRLWERPVAAPQWRVSAFA